MTTPSGLQEPSLVGDTVVTSRWERLRGSVGHARGDSLMRNSTAMMSTTLLNSGLGYIFWIVVASAYSASQVGAATAIIAAATIASTLGDVGLRTSLMQDLPQQRDAASWSARVSSSLLLGALVSGAAGLGAWIVADRLSPETSTLLRGAWPLTLVLFTVGLCLSNIFDGISAAERSAEQLLWRNGLVAIVKVLTIGAFALVGLGADAILVAVVVATAAGTALALRVQLPRLQPGWRFTTNGFTQSVIQTRGSMAGHYLINLGGWLPPFVLPLLVVARLSTQQNAYFSFAWMVGGVFFMVSPSVASALFVQGRWDEEGLHQATIKASKFIAAILLPLATFLAIAGHWVLGLFGDDYARYGYPVLLVLAASAIPDAITNVRVGQLRAQRRLGDGAKINLGMAILSIGLAWVLLPRYGIVGAAMSWLIAQSAGAVWIWCARPARRRA